MPVVMVDRERAGPGHTPGGDRRADNGNESDDRDSAELSQPSSSLTFVKVRVPAKINLYLQVGALQPDGYHDLSTVFQAIDLFDELSVYPSDSLSVTVDGEGAATIPTDSRNLIISAALALAEYTGHKAYARFHVSKNIPVGGGLGGGSANAAAALVACNILWATGLDSDRLEKIAANIGSDVPFLVKGMMALSTGHKEPLVPIECTPKSWCWVLGVPHCGLLTTDVFRKLDAGGANAKPNKFDIQDLLGWGHGKPEDLAPSLGNGLQSAAVALLPELGDALAAGSRAGALASLITGSGSTCLFLARDYGHARGLATLLAKEKSLRKVLVATGPVAGAEVVDILEECHEGGQSC